MAERALIWTGLGEFGEAIERKINTKNQATRKAINEGLLLIQRQAQINSTGRPGPFVRTGSHRRSFHIVAAQAFGSFQWIGMVGPTMVYSRALELGHPRWPPGVKYPSLGPAVTFVKRVALPNLFRRHWAAA